MIIRTKEKISSRYLTHLRKNGELLTEQQNEKQKEEEEEEEEEELHHHFDIFNNPDKRARINTKLASKNWINESAKKEQSEILSSTYIEKLSCVTSKNFIRFKS